MVGFAAAIILAYGGLVGRRYVLKASETRITDNAFEIYDQNKNSLIELGEIAPNDLHLHRVLNIDGKDGITRDEFVSHGTMVWNYVDPDSFKIIKNENGRFKQRSATQMHVVISRDGKMDKLPDNTEMKKYIVANGELVELTGDETILENLGATDGNYEYFRKNNIRSDFSDEAFNKFKIKTVKFDLRSPDRLELSVYEQQSHSMISKSIRVHQRSVIWVEGRKTPELVMGMGREKAVLTKEIQSN